MSACIEDVRVHNDHAIRCSIVGKPVSVLEYVKAVSSVIGASHILAVFEERDSVKVFLNDKRLVDTLIKSCLHVMGHHVKVDYVSPPGTRVVLTDIDPIVSNYDVMRLLSNYGTIVSPVIRPPVSEDTELCHIGYGVRYVYMNLTDESVPEKIEFKYGEHNLCCKVHIEPTDLLMLPNIKPDPLDDYLDNDNSNSSVLSMEPSSPPRLVCVQSVNSIEVGCATPKPSTLDVLPAVNGDSGSSGKKLRGRRPNRVKPMRMTKKITATTKAARKIKRNVKHKWIRKRFRKGTTVGKTMVKAVSVAKKTARKPSNSSSSCGSPLPNIMALLGEKEEEIDITDEILKQEQLLEFLSEVKNHRAPVEVAKKYLGGDCDSIEKFIDQLIAFRKQQSDIAFKSRIWRLIRSLKDSLNHSNESVTLDITD